MSARGSLPEMFRQGVARYPGHAAVIFNGQTTTFTELHHRSDRVAATLAAKGIRPGDRIGLYCPNTDFFPVAYFGILKAGAVVVPVNLLLNPREIVYMLQDAGARGLIYYDAFFEAVASVQREIPELELGICIGARKARPGDLDWSEALRTSGPPPDGSLDPVLSLAAILYTSGTTGRPKGAMLTHANLAANIRSCREALCLQAGADSILVVLPMFHSFAATAGMLLPLMYGCTVVPVPRFDPAGVVQAIRQHGCTIFMGVPSMYTTFLKLPPECTTGLSSLRFCVAGGAAMPVEILKQFEARFGKLIYEGDGPTECSPVTCVNPIEGRRKVGSVGVPVPGVEMKILDEQGGERPVSTIGEICVRGPNVMKGYWRRPEDTQAAFFGEWFRTGDLGYQDGEGYFFIVDRLKDMIIVNGMNVYPRVVEEVLYQHPAIREAAVVGEAHALHGEIPVAFVSLKSGAQAGEADIRAFCREQIGRHEIPRKIHFLPELPKNATGKILKRELRKQGERERGVDIP